jgi:hypothetical protein
MRQIICDSCKTGEELKGDSKAGKDIKMVKLEIWEDERESVPRVPIFADLCWKCRSEMQNTYFRATIDTTEALIEPKSLKSDFVPVDERKEEEVSAGDRR